MHVCIALYVCMYVMYVCQCKMREKKLCNYKMFLHHILSGIPELNKKWSENNNNKTLIVIVIETKKNG